LASGRFSLDLPLPTIIFSLTFFDGDF